MTFTRKVFSLAVLAGGWALAHPSIAEARPRASGNQRFHALARARQVGNGAAFQGLSPDLGFGSIPLPLNRTAVRLFDRFHRRQGLVPPPIPRILQGNLSNNLLNRIAFRQAFALELARERALLRGDNTYGGIFFQPPLGTPFTPVRNINLFTYLPVFRIFGGG